MASFNGLGMHMGNLAILSAAESRSISPENPTGERGKGAEFIPLQDDIASVAYWYQTLPAPKFPPLSSPDYLRIV